MRQRESELPHRFYERVEFLEEGRSFHLELDGRRVRTPGRNLVSLSDKVLMEAIAKEWANQKERIDSRSMPLTRLVNSALDAVALNVPETKADIIAYADSDLLCYRAGSPQALVMRQSQAWDPVLEWVEKTFGARFVLIEGVIHQEQPADALEAIRKEVETFNNPIRLTGLHMATSLTGSLFLALALSYGELTTDEAWAAAHIDEDWNISMWGEDPEAAALRAEKLHDFCAAALALAARPLDK